MSSVNYAGTVMVGIDGTELSKADRKRLELPAVGAVCLFARNYASLSQLDLLVADIRKAAPAQLLVAVDQEGGRVQRFGPPDFASIPPACELGEMYSADPAEALGTALERGELIARELALADIDLSFVPVLDVDRGRNPAIGERAFGSDPRTVAALGLAMVAGLASGGMKAVGKHFPGHGWALADPHTDVAIDERELEDIEAADILPFDVLIKRKVLAAVMTAHVRYPAVDNAPATYSQTWIGEILRGKLGFKGAVVTDDLVMQAAADGAESMAARIARAAAAGCDLFCAVGGEPVLNDGQIARLPATGMARPWLALARGSAG